MPKLPVYGNTEGFLRAHANFKGRECLVWPYTIEKESGYGRARLGGRIMGAHRAMCFIVRGAPPDPAMQAAHRCGNRSCVNPQHVRWATRSINELDKLAHGRSNRGERHGNSKLTEASVLAIFRDARPYAEIGADHGCAVVTVHNIKFGHRWGWLTGAAA
jgi:hypothetical protein